MGAGKVRKPLPSSDKLKYKRAARMEGRSAAIDCILLRFFGLLLPLLLSSDAMLCQLGGGWEAAL